MADRVRTIMRRSSSKIGTSKGSVTHMGTTPYKYKIDIFISHVDNVKTADEVCVLWDRRGKTVNTVSVKVKDGKAIFKETLSMETTLFRRAAPGVKAGSPPSEGEELLFDEKKAKFSLRKGGPTGKAIGKLMMNLSEYVKGVSGSLFVDLKLSNGSVIGAKIESRFLHVGKKLKADGDIESDAGSQMTEDLDGLENDSIFGDDADDLADLEIMVETPTPDVFSQGKGPQPLVTPKKSARSKHGSSESEKRGAELMAVTSPVSASKTASKGASIDRTGPQELAASPTGGLSKKESSSLKESPSLRDKLKSKITGKDKKERSAKVDNEPEELQPSESKKIKKSADMEELLDLRKVVEKLKSENKKLKASKQDAMEEIDALREELQNSENALHDASNSLRNMSSKDDVTSRKLKDDLKHRDKRISELEAQNESLLEELEDSYIKTQSSAKGEDSKKVKKLLKKIAELEIALRREPQYLDVVNELKVAKVSLALANMEREQALFALQQAQERTKE